MLTVLMAGLLLLIPGCNGEFLQNGCRNKDRRVDCSNLGLTKIPQGIPDTTNSLDLSHNPLQFEKDAFLVYTSLASLKLEDCALKSAFNLPKNLKSIYLGNNKFDKVSLGKMFKNASNSLFHISVFKNNVDTDSDLNIFPQGTMFINLDYNKIRTITRSSLQNLKKLRHLRLTCCGIEKIESGAFDYLSSLTELTLNDNQIKYLPPGLFHKTINLKDLDMSKNNLGKLEDLGGPVCFHRLRCEYCGLRELTSAAMNVSCSKELLFGWNEIESFNLSNTKYMELALSYNKIRHLPNLVFNKKKMFTFLGLMHNRIQSISPSAFEGVQEIVELYLQGNNLSKLPENVFKGVTIRKLFLHRNNLTTIKGVLSNMKHGPDDTSLFNNPQLQNIHTDDLKTLSSNASIYLDCKRLGMIVGQGQFQPTIKCSPSQSIEIQTNRKTLVVDGFLCRPHRFFGIRNYICSPCPTGTISQCDNRMQCHPSCIPCPAGGYYQDQLAETKCKQCKMGQYVPFGKGPGKDPLDCLTCPSGTNTAAFAGYRACTCLDGFARFNRFGECIKCNITGTHCRNDYQMLSNGFWWTWGSNKTLQERYRAFVNNLEVKNNSYSRSSVEFNKFLPHPQKCPVHAACLGGLDAVCQRNYTGVLCGVCQKGYYKSFGSCLKCHKPVVALLIFLGYLTLFTMICVVISLTDKITLTEEGPRTVADVILSNCKILLGFYQVLTVVMAALSHVHWPATLVRTISVLEFLQFQLLSIPSLGCIKPEWRLDVVKEFWVGIILTFVVPLIILGWYCIKITWSYLIATCKQRERQKYPIKNYMRVIALFLFVTYPVTSKRIVQILPLSCHTFCVIKNQYRKCLQEISYLRSDYGLKCLTLDSSVSLKVAYASLVVPLGFPVIFLVLLFYFGPKEDKDDESHEDAATGQFALKFAYENYSNSCWYWEVLETIRKLVMTTCLTVLIQHTRIGLAAMITFAWIFAILHAMRRPIKDKFENFVQLLSLCIIPLNMSIAAVLEAKEIADEDIVDRNTDSLLLVIMLVVMNSLVAVLIFGRLLRTFIKMVKRACADKDCSSCIPRKPRHTLVDPLLSSINY